MAWIYVPEAVLEWLRGMDGFLRWRLSLWAVWRNFWQQRNDK